MLHCSLSCLTLCVHKLRVIAYIAFCISMTTVPWTSSRSCPQQNTAQMNMHAFHSVSCAHIFIECNELCHARSSELSYGIRTQWTPVYVIQKAMKKKIRGSSEMVREKRMCSIVSTVPHCLLDALFNLSLFSQRTEVEKKKQFETELVLAMFSHDMSRTLFRNSAGKSSQWKIDYSRILYFRFDSVWLLLAVDSKNLHIVC